MNRFKEDTFLLKTNKNPLCSIFRGASSRLQWKGRTMPSPLPSAMPSDPQLFFYTLPPMGLTNALGYPLHYYYLVEIVRAFQTIHYENCIIAKEFYIF